MTTAKRITNSWTLAVVAMVLGVACTSVNAENIALQTFDTAQDLVAGVQTSWTDGIGDVRTTYAGGGLGFVAAAHTSGSSGGPFDSNISALGKFYTGDTSGSGETFAGATNPGADGKYTPPASITFTDRSGTYALFNTVNLAGHDSSTLTLDLDSNKNNANDSMFVRLFLDGSATGIDLLTIDTDNTTVLGPDTAYVGGTLTYSFDDAATSARLFIGFWADDSADYWTLDNVSFDTTAGAPEPYVFLSDHPYTVASNVPPGTLVGNLSMVNTNGTFTYTLESGGGNDNFSIASGSTNLRTAAWMDAAHNISIVGTQDPGEGDLVVTNDYEITLTAATHLLLKVTARMDLSPTASSQLGILGAQPGSGTSFEIAGGREDLFEIDVSGTNLMQVVGSDPGSAGEVHYVEVKASNAGVTPDAYYLIEATVQGASGTLIILR
ncbi:MAG: cadherin repeat domain-containing protein [Verrucomicrobia bacterium]|nr:cadherin repeat domain-containing protein [Verrucomicrobiota bacterium]MBT7065426.1 cadherin repeat domain-containing protein [Verrucomicrobiota bacterium]